MIKIRIWAQEDQIIKNVKMLVFNDSSGKNKQLETVCSFLEGWRTKVLKVKLPDQTNPQLLRSQHFTAKHGAAAWAHDITGGLHKHFTTT